MARQTKSQLDLGELSILVQGAHGDQGIVP